MGSISKAIGRTILASLLAGGITIASGAQTTPAKTVELGELGQQVIVRLNPGDTLRIVLPANPSTGYSWKASGVDATVLTATGKQNSPGAAKMPGAPGTQALSFTAKASGTDHLTLNYARPWEKNVKPARSYMVDVTVDPAGTSSDAVVTPAGTLIGTYGGKTLCADCSGIVTTVAFYAVGPQQMTDTYYVRTMKYLGAPKGDTMFVSAGKWSLKKGTAADADAIVYSLESNTSDHVDNYQLKGNTLIVLGADGKPAANPYNSNLEKQP